MSILIKGIEMPREGTVIAVYKIEGKFYASYVNGAELHHLVEVPPHGRLIDADALLSQYKGNILTAKTNYADGVRDVIADIYDAPTIIPADEEEQT